MKKLTIIEFIKRARKAHGDKYDYSNVFYKNKRTKVEIRCLTHGIFSQNPESHTNGSGCPSCAGVRKLTTENFIKRAINIHGDKYEYSLTTYKLSSRKVKIVCIKHGTFQQRPNDHLSGKGCPTCKESKGEREIRKILKENGIDFIHQHRFDECRNIKPLPFDFYLPTQNVCIEYQGRQHFEPVKDFGGEKEFNRVLKCDKIKKSYCENNNIPLVAINYNQNVSEELINSVLQL